MSSHGSHHALEVELKALADGKQRSWPQLATLLEEVERSEYWRERAGSFTEWLEHFAQVISLKPATLWRVLSAGRFYASLRSDLAGNGISAPPINALPAAVSPESLELLAKLRRVAPGDVTDEITARVLSGTITRADLRSTWQAYRPALDGRTARGRGVKAPKIDTKAGPHFNSLLEAEVFTGLKYGSKAWTGTSEPHTFQIYMNVKPEFLPDETRRFEFDAVVVVRCASNSALVLHGIDIRPQLTVYAEQAINFVQLASPFCDRLWTAVHEANHGFGWDAIPGYVGVMAAKSQTLRVLREAGSSNGLGSRVGDLAKGLLFSSLAQ